MSMEHKQPEINPESYVRPSAVIIGNVKLGAHSSVWPCAVLRGDCGTITIGDYTSIQDNTTIHTAFDNNTEIGDHVTIGHGAVLHGCKVAANALIGMNATILDGTEIGEGAIIAAGAVVAPNTKIPAAKVAMGAPARITRDARTEELTTNHTNTTQYWQLAQWNKSLAEFDL